MSQLRPSQLTGDYVRVSVGGEHESGRLAGARIAWIMHGWADALMSS
jgi:hypothetical protein